jgi:hypothetical protein
MLGVEDYNPYAPGAVATNILPFATGPRVAGAAAGALQRLFPNIGRETAAYSGAELAAAGAREVAPDSTAAQLLASFVGGTAGSALGSRPDMLGIVKPKGGNWLDESINDQLTFLKARNQGMGANSPSVALEEMQRTYTPEVLSSLSPENAAIATRSMDLLRSKVQIDNWIDTKLRKYIKNEMGTETDPVRALAERGILHVDPDLIGVNRYRAPEVRRGAGFPEEGLGQSDAAKAWEAASDVAINPTTPESMLSSRYDSERFLTRYPWLQNIPNDTSIYGLNSQRGTPAALGFDHIIDELQNATRPNSDLPARLRIDPAKLDRISVPQLVEKVSEINSWRAEQKVLSSVSRANNEATSTFREYATVPGTDQPNQRGLRWVELKEPDALPQGWSRAASGDYIMPDGTRTSRSPMERELSSALKYEGDIMGHCVGGYCERVLNGESRIYSLRDSKGEPHVTIEVANTPTVFSDIVRAVGDDAANQMLDQGMNIKEMMERIPEFNKPERIVQVKGKQNKAPVEEYLPFVQDFVKTGLWSRVDDIKNTGLVDISELSMLDPNTYREAVSRGMIPETGYISAKQYDDVWRDINGYAKGGEVSSAKTMLDRLISTR